MGTILFNKLWTRRYKKMFRVRKTSMASLLTDLTAAVGNFETFQTTAAGVGAVGAPVLLGSGGLTTNATFLRIQAGFLSTGSVAASADQLKKASKQVVAAAAVKPAGKSLALGANTQTIRFFQGDGLSEPVNPAEYLSAANFFKLYKDLFKETEKLEDDESNINTPLKRAKILAAVERAGPFAIISKMSFEEKRDWVIGALQRVGLAK